MFLQASFWILFPCTGLWQCQQPIVTQRIPAWFAVSCIFQAGCSVLCADWVLDQRGQGSWPAYPEGTEPIVPGIIISGCPDGKCLVNKSQEAGPLRFPLWQCFVITVHTFFVYTSIKAVFLLRLRGLVPWYFNGPSPAKENPASAHTARAPAPPLPSGGGGLV
jgi:hypothetical protein